MAKEKQRLRGPVTNRTWATLTTTALLAVGAEGAWSLFRDGDWAWIKLAALALGLVSMIDLIRRWREI